MKDINYIVGFVLSGIIIFITLIAYISEKRKFKKLNKEIKEEKEKIQEDWLKEAQQKFEEESYSKQKELAERIQEKEQYITSLENNAYNELEKLKNQRLSIEKEISEKSEFNASLLRIREEELERVLKEKKIILQTRIQSDINNWAKSAQEAAEFRQSQIFKNLQVEIDEKDEELRNLQMEVNEFRSKRNAINEEIMRARAIEEKQDFYRIQIPENSLEDIHYLLSIIDQFNHKEIIYKLIWSEYIQQPFKLMLNRVLKNKEPRNVIYMIQNLKTKEIYIGKTKAEVSKRWTEHIKTSLNIGTISHSNIHNALFNNWDNFSFSILEEVDSKENLNSREKYYIDFYQSNIYGYNIKSGG